MVSVTKCINILEKKLIYDCTLCMGKLIPSVTNRYITLQYIV